MNKGQNLQKIIILNILKLRQKPAKGFMRHLIVMYDDIFELNKGNLTTSNLYLKIGKKNQKPVVKLDLKMFVLQSFQSK